MLSQQRVNLISSRFLANASIEQNKGKSRPRTFNHGFGEVGKSQTDTRIFLASVSKILILAEMERSLASMPVSHVPFTAKMLEEARNRNPSRVKQLHHIYSGTELPIDELFYQVAAMSSNSATQAVKQLRGDVVGLDELQAAYTHLAPSYVMLQTLEDNHHWMEYLPNTGNISEIAAIQHRLVQRVASGEARETERMLVDSMTNNLTDFGFCINQSNLGLKLKSRDVKVIEKTGYYPAYTWGLGMADLGYPVVLTQATVFSLLAPDGEVRTFWGFVNTEVPMPWETILEGGIAFPNDEGSQFMAYIRKIKPNLDSEFRSYITALVHSA